MDYEQRFEQLWARYSRLNGTLDWPGFVDWLSSLRSSLRPASWRQYRAAVTYAMGVHGVQDSEGLVEKLRHPLSAINSRRPDLPARTSSSKSKTLSTDDLLALSQHMDEHGGRWDSLTIRWLIYASLTGLRPVEWSRAWAEIADNEVVLHVQNAKHDDVRAHGAERHIHIKLNAENQPDFLRFLQELQSHDFEDSYQGCRLALWRATKTLWPRRKRKPTLYSARHQFSADAKSAGLLPEEIAAMMGHAVTETHQTHYGKRRSGRGRVQVEAEASDVERVVVRMQQKRGAGLKSASL